MRKILAAIALTLLIAFPASAAAQSNPGNSAGDQYEENVPGPGGNNGGNDGDGGNGGSGGGSGAGSGSLPQATQQQLQASGPDGAAAADLAEQTDTGGASGGDDAGAGPGSPANAGAGAGDDAAGGAAGDKADSAGSGGGSGVGEIAQAATGTDDSGGGTGILLPILIVLAIAASAGYILFRRRNPSAPDPA